MKSQTRKPTIKEIKDKIKKDKLRKDAYDRRKKADDLRKNSGLKMKKVHLHQETLRDIKTLATEHGFVISDNEIGYDDLSCLITLLVDMSLQKDSFEVVHRETTMLKRLHLTVKHCKKKTPTKPPMSIGKISKLFRDSNYSLPQETIQRLLDRKPSESDLNWSSDLIKALANEERIKSVIAHLTH